MAKVGRKQKFPGQELRYVHVRLPEKAIAQMDALAKRHGLRSRTDVLLWLLKRAAAEHGSDDEHT